MLIGQVIWLKCKYSNGGQISKSNRPYIIIEINVPDNYIEVVEMSSLEGKLHKITFESNHLIKNDNPVEKAFSKLSFVKMDILIQIELFDELENFITKKDLITDYKIRDLKEAIKTYRSNNTLLDENCLYIDKTEILKLNC